MRYENSGIFIIDKPENMTSAGVVARVKKFLRAKKVGHAGTLDPFATGVMICCVNQATRLARFFLHGDKTYQAVLYLGIETDTQDSTGTILAERNPEPLAHQSIYTVFKQFEGRIRQFPPVYSALKHNGVPLYKLARSGKPVQKPARDVFISSLKIKEINLPEIRFEVSCSGGTYIRTLCADIGKKIGCGGHLKALRRVQSSGFSINEAIPLDELKQRSLVFHSQNGLQESETLKSISMSDALRNMPIHLADQPLIQKIAHGRRITNEDITASETHDEISVVPKLRLGNEDLPNEHFVKIVDAENNLLAVVSHSRETKYYNYCGVFHTA